jgi:maltose-binding protein MalE
MAPSTAVATLAEGQLIGDLTGLIPPNLRQQYLPQAHNSLRYQEQSFGLPMSLELMALYYKTDAVTDPPRLLDDLIGQTAQDNQAAITVGFDHSFWGVTAFGALTFDSEYHLQLDEEAMLAWLEWLQAVGKLPGVQLSRDYQEMLDLFVNGDAAFLPGESGSLSEIRAALGDESVAVVPLPGSLEQEARPFLTTRGLMLNPATIANQAQLEAALTFMQYVTNTESQTLLMQELDHLPSNINVDAAGFPVINGFLAQATSATARPNRIVLAAFQTTIDDIYADVLDGQLGPPEALEEISAAIEDYSALGSIP